MDEAPHTPPEDRTDIIGRYVPRSRRPRGCGGYLLAALLGSVVGKVALDTVAAITRTGPKVGMSLDGLCFAILGIPVGIAIYHVYLIKRGL